MDYQISVSSSDIIIEAVDASSTINVSGDTTTLELKDNVYPILINSPDLADKGFLSVTANSITIDASFSNQSLTIAPGLNITLEVLPASNTIVINSPTANSLELTGPYFSSIGIVNDANLTGVIAATTTNDRLLFKTGPGFKIEAENYTYNNTLYRVMNIKNDPAWAGLSRVTINGGNAITFSSDGLSNKTLNFTSVNGTIDITSIGSTIDFTANIDAVQGFNQLNVNGTSINSSDYTEISIFTSNGIFTNITGNVINLSANIQYAPINSPNFIGVPQVTTLPAGTQTNNIASTLYVVNTFNQIFAPNLVSVNNPNFTGTVTAPTPSTNTNNNQVATTMFVNQFMEQFLVKRTGIVPITPLGASGDLPGVYATNVVNGTQYFYFCTAPYNGTTNIWARIAGSTW